MRQKLTARVEAVLDPVGEVEALKIQIVDIVRDAQLELFKLYRSSRHITLPAPPDVTSPSTESASVADLSIEETPDLDEGGKMSEWAPEKPYDFSMPENSAFRGFGLGGFDGILFDLGRVLSTE